MRMQSQVLSSRTLRSEIGGALQGRSSLWLDYSRQEGGKREEWAIGLDWLARFKLKGFEIAN